VIAKQEQMKTKKPFSSPDKEWGEEDQERGKNPFGQKEWRGRNEIFQESLGFH